MYERTETRMRQLLERDVDLAWFDRFFGVRPTGDLRVIPGLVNGGTCYGLKHKRAEYPATAPRQLVDEGPKAAPPLTASRKCHSRLHS